MLLFVHVHVLYSLPSHYSSLPFPPLPSPPLPSPPQGSRHPSYSVCWGDWKWQRRIEGIGPPPTHGAAELWCPGRDGWGHDPLPGRQHWKVSEYMYVGDFVSVWQLDTWPNLPDLIWTATSVGTFPQTPPSKPHFTYCLFCMSQFTIPKSLPLSI